MLFGLKYRNMDVEIKSNRNKMKIKMEKINKIKNNVSSNKFDQSYV